MVCWTRGVARNVGRLFDDRYVLERLDFCWGDGLRMSVRLVVVGLVGCCRLCS